jgi:hypothetical protein
LGGLAGSIEVVLNTAVWTGLGVNEGRNVSEVDGDSFLSLQQKSVVSGGRHVVMSAEEGSRQVRVVRAASAVHASAGAEMEHKRGTLRGSTVALGGQELSQWVCRLQEGDPILNRFEVRPISPHLGVMSREDVPRCDAESA